MSCPREAHVHRINVFGIDGYLILDHARGFSAQVGTEVHAHRIAELVNRHGLIDVPEPEAFADPIVDTDDQPIPYIRTDKEADS